MALSPTSDLDSAERALTSKLRRVKENSAGTFAVHIHLSMLRESNRQPYYITVASRVFEDFISGNDAQLYGLYNGDLVLVCRMVSVDDLDIFIEKARVLFPDDPLTMHSPGSFEDQFATWHDLSQTDELQAFSIKAQTFESDGNEYREANAGGAESAGEIDLGTPLAPDNLSAINQLMKKTQIADLIKNQPIYRVVPGQLGEVVFRENFIAMGELKARVAPGINLFSSPWLFQYLTETLDKRMLAVIGKRNMAGLKDHVSLNLNISTIMSREFQLFNKLVGEHANKFIIEFQMIDIFSDMNSYQYACDLLRESGYRILVDGLNPLIINFFDPAMLYSNYLKINWGPEFTGDEKNDAINDVRTVVKHAGKDNVILARVDSQAAIQWGASLGVTRYQGYFIDKLVDTILAQKSAKGRA